MTIEAVGPEMVDLLPPLPAFSPPAKIIDKHVYSPWPEGRLQTELAERRIDTLVITGASGQSPLQSRRVNSTSCGTKMEMSMPSHHGPRNN